MDTKMKEYTYENGEIQRVQLVQFDDWKQLDFLHLKHSKAALGCFADIYRLYLVPTLPLIFEQMVLFSLPENFEAEKWLGKEKTYQMGKYGKTTDVLTAVTALLQEGVVLKKGQPVFKNTQAKALWKELEQSDCLRIVCGKKPGTKIIPINAFPGYLSETEPEAAVKVNASFFIMDRFDCATIYDQVGTPFGLNVKDGLVSNPPLFGREALLVKKDGTVTIKQLDVRQMPIEIGGTEYIHGQNAVIYTRPEKAKVSCRGGICHVIIGRKVVSVVEKGTVQIPASGMVLWVKKDKTASAQSVLPGADVTYKGMEDVVFGIQVGNSIICDGVKTEQFISKFYNIYHLEPVAFPPSLYPMDFDHARAARIALGADKDGRPMILWAEGKGKLSYTPGKDSTGASLKEMAEICKDLGFENAINLDGGGSAQILIRNQRALHISDRKAEDNSDAERLVPLGLIVR